MRIVCLAENLGPGGAERQLAELAVLLAQSGHDVHVVLYHDANHYGFRLEEASIPVHIVFHRNRLDRVLQLRKALRGLAPTAVIVFKRNPAFWVELSSVFGRDYRLIVSERGYDYRGVSVGIYLRLLLHTLADVVIANSNSQCGFIRSKAPWLARKTLWIPNTIDLQRFRPAERNGLPPRTTLGIVVLARFAREKNPVRFVHAIDQLRQRVPNVDLVVDWYGSDFFVNRKPTQLSKVYLRVKDEIQRLRLERVIRLHEPVSDIAPLLHECDALCLPSLSEGFSNVIAEAIACGIPVLAGNVSDNHLMVRDGFNGFLFDPMNPSDIADAVLRFWGCSFEERQMMGKRSREIAEDLFSEELFIKRYTRVLRASNKME